MPRFAANLSMMFSDAPFLQRFGRAAAVGFKGVEYLFPYDFTPAELAERLAEHGLSQVLFNLPPGDFAAGERGIAALPGREAEFREGVDRAIEYAHALGCPKLHAMAGLVSEEGMRPRMREVYLENLRYAARRLAEHRLTLLIEPINSRSIPGYFINYQAEGHAILAELGEPNLKVQMDFFHAQIMEGDLTACFKRFQAGVGHIQIAGVPDRHEPDTGEVNYPQLFALLDELGYDGWIGCEYSPRGLTEDGLGWFAPWR
ncbi:hydroxypyruvate isomerase family protein [Pseudomonas seleniipraecipitans]|uniref:Hydroxypyruvate isomerase family protein n=1 Tax=Phytopseudomonas seleniipraecipitans TaxID=640205 RepID=A0ABY5J7T7_9GAMM|nr:2-oxo-tetronate isomerase [Pseudomonas seleniipraecipitans]UUD63710.1 hydroxypyruvate isomerase family protein [Pseudomonas seleniipraecipitans]